MQNNAAYQHKLALVYQRLDGPMTLEPIIICTSDTGQLVFDSIKKKQYDLTRTESRLWFLNLLLTKLEVGIAEIRWTHTDDKMTKLDGMRVELRDFEQYHLFSEAIRHPASLANEPDFLMEYGSLILRESDDLDGLVGQQVLVVYTIADKEKIAWLLLLALILSPALGLIVGQFTQRAEVGVAVAAGVFACASFLQGLAAWIHK
ncbi:MAG: hypothetical protein Q9215_001409 [Flavoplaca cf. flavocitrina]